LTQTAKKIFAPQTLDDATFSSGVNFLCQRDPHLKRIVQTYGAPPIWTRERGFPTLLHIILEQQVSIASARATFERLRQIANPLTPRAFLRLTDEVLREIGFSRQKIVYSRELARALLERRLNLRALETMRDEAVMQALTRIKGIGQWTADVYLLMALRRADAFPAGDLGVVVAVQEVKNFAARPTREEILEVGENWRPFRAVATRILWQYYLNRKRK
jgi:DNA-3-methyladenine glycosylase II